MTVIWKKRLRVQFPDGVAGAPDSAAESWTPSAGDRVKTQRDRSAPFGTSAAESFEQRASGSSAIANDEGNWKMLERAHKNPTIVLVLLLVGCGDLDGRIEFAPADKIGPDAPARNPVTPVERTGQALITFPCKPKLQDVNHLDSMPTSGCSNGVATGQDSRDGMEYFQRWRQHLGLPCVDTPDYAQAAAGWHAIYMSTHAALLTGHTECFVDGHGEKPGCTYFTGVSPRDQLISAGMDTRFDDYVAQVTGDAQACALGPRMFFAGMLAAPYHRLSMMKPQARYAGFASIWQDHLGFESWGVTLQMSGPRFKSAGSRIPTVFYPIPGDSNVPLTFSGVETPQPPSPPGGWENGSGYPVSILMPDAEFTGTAFCRVEPDGTCTSLPHVSLLSTTDPRRHTPPNGAHLYAHEGLTTNTVYRAQFFGTSNGVNVAPWWEFRTKD